MMGVPILKKNMRRHVRGAFDFAALRSEFVTLLISSKTSIVGKSWENRNGDRCGIRAGCGLSYLRSDEFWDRLVEKFKKSQPLRVRMTA